MHLFYQPGLTDGIAFLDEEESRHCVKVLRLGPNDPIKITDGAGGFYEARIIRAGARKVEFETVRKSIVPGKDHHIHIAIAPTKNTDRMEWFVEKSVEIGIDQISLLRTGNTQRTKINIGRIRKKAVSAMKQAQKASLPALHDIDTLTGFMAGLPENVEKFIAYVDPNNPLHLKNAAHAGQNYIVLIGPEGDFTPDEIALAQQKGFVAVSLAASRLRTETAGLVACHILNLVNE